MYIMSSRGLINDSLLRSNQMNEGTVNEENSEITYEIQ
jgi:hypothetical protein